MVWTNDSIRDLERTSIRAFVQRAADMGYLSGRVLDYGCGKQPYRDIVEAAGGSYEPYDRAQFPANVSGEDIGPDLGAYLSEFDTVLCTQIIQYIEDPGALLAWFCDHVVRRGGHLVMTGPTNWQEIELEDMHRWTVEGARRYVRKAGFELLYSERRAVIEVGPGVTFSLGWGVIAQA